MLEGTIETIIKKFKSLKSVKSTTHVWAFGKWHAFIETDSTPEIVYFFGNQR